MFAMDYNLMVSRVIRAITLEDSPYLLYGP